MENDSRLIVMMVTVEMVMDATRTVKSRKDITVKEDLQLNLVPVFHFYLINHTFQAQEQSIYSEELFRVSD